MTTLVVLAAEDLDARIEAALRRALDASGLRAPAQPEALYLSVPAFAARVGVSERTAWTWARNGMPTIGSGRTRRVDVARADEWLRSRSAALDDRVERAARKSATKAARRRSA